jgi:MscS family membrane protein
MKTRYALILILVGCIMTSIAGLTNTGALAATEQEAPPNEPAPAQLPVGDFSKPMGPPDKFNRGTPRGSMYGFITASRRGDFERAANYMDLRRLPPEERKRGPQIARQFWSVLRQNLWVDFATLSDRNEGFADDGLPAWQDWLGDIETKEGLVTLLLQRVPRKEDGVRIWKISSSTVARTADLYAEFGPGWIETWLPPMFFEVKFRGLALWQWLGLVMLALVPWIVFPFVAGTIIRYLGALFIRKGGTVDEKVVNLVRRPVYLALTILVFALGRRYLDLDIPVQKFLHGIERTLWVLSAVWLTFRLIDFSVISLRARALRRGSLGLIPVLPPLMTFTKVLIVLIGVLGTLGSLGVNISAAVAGLGVGGIAVALAAQRTIENLFGGVTLYADRPVRVGDFFRYGDQVGTVEEIGLRSTRVRTLDRTVITIPNAQFSNMALENFAKRDRMRLWTMIGVRYETTPDQLRFLLARLREILLAHPRVTDDPARVRFFGFGAYSLDMEVFAYVNTQDWNEFLQIREDIYLRFMDAVKEAGTGFAFPSSTMYLGRDTGLNKEEVGQAEARVAEWRDKGIMPFPHFPQSVHDEIENTLDWPPPGSPDGPPARKEEKS